MIDGILVGTAAAFFGAFFGYFFNRFTDWIKSHVERRRLHKNALVRLERIFGSLLNTIHDDILVCDSLKATFADSLKGNSPAIAHLLFHDVDADPDLLLNVLNIDFINAVFSFQMTAKRLNRLMDTFNRSYGELRSGILAKSVSVATYQNNLPYFLTQIEVLEGALKKSEGEVQTLAACCRALLKKRYWLDSLNLPLIEKFDHTTIRLTEEEREALLKEINEQAPAKILSELSSTERKRTKYC